jgi:oligoendopeptidase F
MGRPVNGVFASLPGSALEFMRLGWSEIEPFFRELENRQLTAGGLDSWLHDWTKLHALIRESYARLQVELSGKTEDESARDRFHAFINNVQLAAQPYETRLKRKLIESGLKPRRFNRPLQNMTVEAALFREENLPLLADEEELNTDYDRIIGAQTVEWDGEEMTISQLARLLQEEDRGKREKAWRLASERQLADRDAINDLWTKYMPLRRDLAANAGFSSYRDFRWRQLRRIDYSSQDCFRFHQAIHDEVVPAALEIYERRRTRLGLSTLRPWDLDVDPFSRPPLLPFETVDDLIDNMAQLFSKVDPKLGRYFETMREENLLDLDNRKGKAPGGFCTFYASIRKPFIFMNAVGLHRDVKTLLHESGHAFHAFEIAALPYHQQWEYGMEFAEVASMSMELLGAPFLSESTGGGGFYSENDAARARIEHLEKIILFWPYMAVVDAFQHWVYENHEVATDPENCDSKWTELWLRFMPGIDYSGLEQDLANGWHRKLHIHQLPFYYVEYGLAQLGAVQVWEKSIKNRRRAVADYLYALSLGCAPLPELYKAAGAQFTFKAGALKKAVKLLSQAIDELESIVSN